MHGHPLPIEVVVADDIGAGHFKERADVVGADAVARLLDAHTYFIGLFWLLTGKNLM